MSVWWYILKDRKHGPFDVAEIEVALREGRINASTSVWREGMANWVRLEETADLSTLLSRR